MKEILSKAKLQLFSFLHPECFTRFSQRYKNKLLSQRFSKRINSVDRQILFAPVYAKGYKYITIGRNFSAGPGFRIECWDRYMNFSYNPSIVIGNNVSFNYNCHIGAINRISIGDNVLVGSNVLITDHGHGSSEDIDIPPSKRPLYSKGPIVIEENVWIGECVAILPGVTVGRNSIIGANAVVTKDIPPYSIVGGNPAKVIKNMIDQHPK